MIHVCIPVLKRYDLLRDLVMSLQVSDVLPDVIYVIDNGRNTNKMLAIIDSATIKFEVFVPEVPLGVAQSWNWFIDNVPEERVIVNDDVTFAHGSLKKLLASDADLVWAEGCGFSCFVLRDACVRKIGKFDETISPGYGYYEDEDYLQRLDGRGTREPSARAENVDCGVKHYHSATLQASTHAEIMEHHRRFKIAQANYIKKWHLEETFK